MLNLANSARKVRLLFLIESKILNIIVVFKTYEKTTTKQFRRSTKL